jgi:hypothetical protein
MTYHNAQLFLIARLLHFHASLHAYMHTDDNCTTLFVRLGSSAVVLGRRGAGIRVYPDGTSNLFLVGTIGA